MLARLIKQFSINLSGVKRSFIVFLFGQIMQLDHAVLCKLNSSAILHLDFNVKSSEIFLYTIFVSLFSQVSYLLFPNCINYWSPSKVRGMNSGSQGWHQLWCLLSPGWCVACFSRLPIFCCWVTLNLSFEILCKYPSTAHWNVLFNSIRRVKHRNENLKCGQYLRVWFSQLD